MAAIDQRQRVALTAGTFPHRGLLGLWGCRWDRRKRVWLAPAESAAWIFKPRCWVFSGIAVL